MTLPGGDPGDKPRDQAGEDPHDGTHEPPLTEQATPPAYGPPPPHGPVPTPPQYGGYPVPEGYPAPGGYHPAGAPPQHTATNTMAIASLVISVLGLVPYCGGILSIVGITLGAVALSQIKETRQKGYGLAVSGMVVGVGTLIVGLILTLFALR
jgi:hypothetical protein